MDANNNQKTNAMAFYKTATPRPSPTHETATQAFTTATLGLRLALRLFGKSYYYNTTICFWKSGTNELLHVHHVGEGERVVSKSFSSYMGKGEGVVIKLLLVV